MGVSCPISIPDELVNAPAQRPAGIPYFGAANLSTIRMVRRRQPTGPQWFAPDTNGTGSSWSSHIWASQFPLRCDGSKFLLFEDDLSAQGFGYSLNFYKFALLMAMTEGRVLLEVPVDPNWQPKGGGNTSKVVWNETMRYSRTGRHSPSRRARWCSQPPFTLMCFFDRWSHCATPDESEHVAPQMHSRWAFVIGKWPARERVVRVKLSWIYCSWFLWEGRSSAAEPAAVAFLLRPRAWVREQSRGCIGGRARFRTRNYVSVHLRDSAEKRHELRMHGHSMPSVASYAALAVTASGALEGDGVVVHTSSDVALKDLTAHLTGANLKVVHTEHGRNDHDEWGGWLAAGLQSPTEQTLQGAIGIVNAEIAADAAVMITPTFSAWSQMLKTLLARGRDEDVLLSSALRGQGQQLANGGSVEAEMPISFCCGCSPREKRSATGNVMAIISSSLSWTFRERIRHNLAAANPNVTGCTVV